MKRSISTLCTTLLFSIAVVPSAMAQMQSPAYPTNATNSPDQSVFDSTTPSTESEMKTGAMPNLSQNQTSTVSSINAGRSQPSVDELSVNSPYPAYCPFLPPGTQPDDWDYREALQDCLYGT